MKAEIASLALDPVMLTADQSIISFIDVVISFINLLVSILVLLIRLRLNVQLAIPQLWLSVIARLLESWATMQLN